MKTIILWLLTIFILSVYPFKSNAGIPFADKALHFMLYAITCALFYSALKGKLSFAGALFVSVVLSAGYGFLMELVQGFLSWRNFSMWDELANFLGASAYAVFIMLRRRFYET